jgi:hypothetical protein
MEVADLDFVIVGDSNRPHTRPRQDERGRTPQAADAYDERALAGPHGKNSSRLK